MIRLGVRVRREHAEAALFALLALAPSGVEEIEIDAGTVEYVIYGSSEALPGEAELRRRLGPALRDIDAREIAEDWQERWREFHRPVSVADRLRVRAPWHERDEPALLEIVVEPGQAFGTGAHATTRMCLELLVCLESAGQAGGTLLDIGCGSGVLAIAAAKLGFDPVMALDNDPLAVQATTENARVNGVRLDVRDGDLSSEALPPADTIVANLLLEPLLELARRLHEAPRTLIASGLIYSQGEALSASLACRLGLRERERRSEGEWLAILYERGPVPPYSLA